MAKVRALDAYVNKGGAQAGSLETLKEAFPKSSGAVDALHDALARRALLKAEDAASPKFVTNLMKEAAGSKATPSAAIKAARNISSSSSSNVARGGVSAGGGVMNQAVINALLAHIQPNEEKKR